jgi:hypothetical protein
MHMPDGTYGVDSVVKVPSPRGSVGTDFLGLSRRVCLTVLFVGIFVQVPPLPTRNLLWPFIRCVERHS